MSTITEGLVLKVTDTGESDRLVTLLTAEFGVIRAFANRAKKMKSNMHAATEAFCYGEYSIYIGKDSYTIESAQAKEVFFGLRQNIESLALGQYFCSLAMEFVPEGIPAPDTLKILLNSLAYLQNGRRTPDFLKAVTELKLLAIAGFAPDLTACAGCGENPKGDVYFSTSQGKFYCKNHPRNDMVITAGVLTAMRHIVANPVNRIYSFSVSPYDEKLLVKACEDFLLKQTNKSFNALDFYKTVTAD
ncbi:MAG: DNA repair protein RecO [Clostridia bacterium]|nr:DNA repair protein RecO [Clostridia bacterium]